MGLLPGTRLGSYEVIAPLGAGGMGEVYRVRDSRLERVVALKSPVRGDVAGAGTAGAVSPRSAAPRVAESPAYRRESTALEEAEGRLAIAMELVEGDGPRRAARTRSDRHRRDRRRSRDRSPKASRPHTSAGSCIAI